jgi:MHS family citrate/tricarballylate:H+ symporter-like MFS transporter
MSDEIRGTITRKQIAAVCVGNGLDFYDFLTFAYFAPQIGRTMFPGGDSGDGLLYALLTFGAGFLTRPIGGLLFGRYADRRGRKPAMIATLTPSYAAIGMAAPVLAVTFRLLQGLALGGEVGPNTAYLLEAAPPGKGGFYVAMQYVSQNAAVVISGAVGSILAAVLTPADLDAYGWRIAFLLGVSIVPFAVAVRRTLEETLPPEETRTPPAQHSFRAVLLGGGLMLGAGTIASYSLEYLGTYAQTVLALPPSSAFLGLIVLGGTGIVGDLVIGRAIDRGLDLRVLLVPWILAIVLIVPAFMVLNDLRTTAALLGITALLAMLLEAQNLLGLILFVRALPTAVRATALGGVYALAIAIFGGSTQPVVNRLLAWTGNPLAPAWYLSGALVIGLAGVLMVMRGSRSRAGAPSLLVGAA